MKTLYYTVDKEIDGNSQDGFTLTGNKIVEVYEILLNEPKHFCSLDLTIEDNTEDAIDSYLEDNGYGDDKFTLIEL